MTQTRDGTELGPLTLRPVFAFSCRCARGPLESMPGEPCGEPVARPK